MDVGRGLALVCSSRSWPCARRPLPPPPPPATADQTGDNVRTIEWEPPVPIPGLSRWASLWLGRAAARPIPPAIATRLYAERARLIRHFAASAELSALLGVEPARDQLEPLDGDLRRRVMAFEQRFTRGVTAVVRGGRVSIHLDASGTAISRVVSTFQPDLEPPEVEIAPAEAIETALSALADQVAVPVLAPDDPVPLVVLRLPGFISGARRASEVRRGNDRIAYSVRVVTNDAVQRELAEVLVDAATGEPVEVIPFGKIPTLHVGLVPHELATPSLFVGEAIMQAVMCGAEDGQGPDTDLILRRFSTTHFPLHSPSFFAMVSCNEWLGDRMVNANDIVTFRDDPTVGPGFDAGRTFIDDDNVWVGTDPLVPEAVNIHYWGERTLRFFKKAGYATREGSGQPARFVAWRTTKDPGGATVGAAFSKLKTPMGDENGVIFVMSGGPHFKTAADPMVLAHEFGHSVYRDTLPHAANQTEEKSIGEGIADCFAAAALRDMKDEWEADPVNHPPHLGYSDPVMGHPEFSFWAGSYKDALNLTKPGYPNLFNPKESSPTDWPVKPFRFSHWSGLRPTDDDYEEKSTLVGAVCRLLVTGGHSWAKTNVAETAGGSPKDALYDPVGVPQKDKERVGFERLRRLLLYTLIDSKNHAKTFHDFIEILAGNAKQLAKTEWPATSLEIDEKVRRAFGEYGFGRGSELEPNDPTKLNLLGNSAAANLIAAGSNFHRPIEGGLCTTEEDFFVVNEKAAAGDEVDFQAELTGGNAQFEVRFYQDKACDFEEGQIQTCAPSRQVYPPLNTPPEQALQSDTFTFSIPGGGGCTAPCPDPKYRRLFVGIRMKPGGTCKSKYKLTVKYKSRAPGNKGVD